MVGFLIKRPIAVLMVFLGILTLGLVAGSYLPVSLVPDIDIPRISVRIDAPAYSSRELEGAMMSSLRTQLMQVNKLSELKSETRDGRGIMSLEFEHGTNIDLAYIEVNEQVDKAMAGLPRDISRPAVIKASASDIPVFYLDISHRSDTLKQHGHLKPYEQQFLELSAFADEIIRRRLEQIPQVAMADMSGRSFPEILVTPNTELLRTMGLAPEAIENTIKAGTMAMGNIILRDKQFQYHVRMGGQLLTTDDIAGLYLYHLGRIWQLGELCTIETRIAETDGMVFSQNRRAISMAIIKQGDARMQDLRSELRQLVRQFESDYPYLAFTITRDQTQLLDVTLANLRQTLMLGAILAFVVMFVFLRDPRAPWLIMIAVPAALVVSLLVFFLVGISINIISISGLILCIGMMIDNSIIVIDNISRYRSQGKSIYDACVTGTNEVFTPLFSSALTTCSVFIPLVFLSGLAGALFFDQAMAVTIGLMISLLIAMAFIPVLYHAIYKNKPPDTQSFLKKLNPINYEKLYSKGFRFVMRRQWVVWVAFAITLSLLILFASTIDKERLPQMNQQATLLWVDWNEHIHVEENFKRVEQLLEQLQNELVQSAVHVGRQQFLLESLHNTTRQQSLLYLLARTESDLDKIENTARTFFSTHYPAAIIQFREEGNLFDQVFGDRQPPLEIRLKALQTYDSAQPGFLQNTIDSLQQVLPFVQLDAVALQQNILLMADLQLMALHQVDMASLQRSLSRLFNENQIATLMDGRVFIPVKLGSSKTGFNNMLQSAKVMNKNGVEIPLHLLLKHSRSSDLSVITAGLEGEYYPVPLQVNARQIEPVMEATRAILHSGGLFEASFVGNLFARKRLMHELLLVGAVALMLLFFILAAQFESLKLPLIVLLEVPLAMAGALLMLWLFGATLNIMSMIGMVVMSGIIINDSILKIDTIKRQRRHGMSLIRALYTAGHYRLKPILMTSITTIFALMPMVFIGGLGGDLQKPLALVVIGGLGFGTFVSLYFIPVFYFYLYKREGGVG